MWAPPIQDPGFLAHGRMTAPGRHAAALDRLSDDVVAILQAVRGLLVHGDYLGLYGLEASDFSAHSRETLPVAARLDRVFRTSDRPLTVARPVERREVGTCRDYALLTCGFLRHKGIPARVRCGFATYLSPGRFEDHWICEHWRARERRWVGADAQLDAAHRDHLGVAFDSAQMPEGAFVTAPAAWDLIESAGASPESFGHGEARGAWFVAVNLARDCLSLAGRETSPWDGWRQVVGRAPGLSAAETAAETAACRAVAERSRRMERGDAEAAALPELEPFWLRAGGEGHAPALAAGKPPG